MLAHSLILGRDLLLSGSAYSAVDSPKQDLIPFKRAMEKAGGLVADPKRDVPRLQPNVRAVLAEMEVLADLKFEALTAPSVRRGFSLSHNGTKLVSLRAPTFDEFYVQLRKVQSYADLRAERTPEILAQVVPQTAAWSAIAGLTPERHRYTLELLGIGLRFAMMMVMKFKYLLACPRPVEYSATVQPMILTPGYSAYPSGHATEAYFAASLLPAIAGSVHTEPSSMRGQLQRLAYRISENRVVAGLHFPIDSLAGQCLGTALAEYFAWACKYGEGFSGDAEFPISTADDKALCTLEPRLDLSAVDAESLMLKTGAPNKVKALAGRYPTLNTLWTLAKPEMNNDYA